MRTAPRWAALLVGAWAVHATLLAALTRWFELAFAWAGVGVVSGETTVWTALVEGALLPTVVAGIGLSVWAVFRASRSHPAVSLAAALGIMGGFGAVISIIRPYPISRAWKLGTASAVAGDLLLIGMMALGALLLLTLARGRVRRILAGGLVLIGGAVLLFQGMALMYVIGLQNSMAPSILWHTLFNVGELMPVLASELTVVSVVMAALWTGVILAPLVALAFPKVRNRLSRAPEATGVGGALWTALPLLGLLLLVPSPPPMIGGGLLSRISASFQAPEVHVTPELAAVHTFDARAAHLVPVRDTPALNVVVVVLESHRRDSTTPYTPHLQTTPFLDSLSRQGLLVDEMFAVMPHTNKSLISIFGGVYPRLTPDFAANKPGGLPARALPALLTDHGYASAFFTPATMEFEDKGAILDNLGFAQRYGDGDFDTGAFETANYFGYEDASIVDSTHAWIDRQTEAEKPFMLGVLTLTSHHPYAVPSSFPRERFSDDPERDDYLNSIRYTDTILRGLWRGIEARGLASSTLLIVVGDHGEAFGEHGARTHSDVIWDEALAVPALVVGPGIEPGRARGPRSLIDVLPTVADALGYTVEGAELPGRSLLRPVPEDRVLFHAPRAYDAAAAMRRGRRKFIASSHRPPQIFDLGSDPGERVDLASGDDSPEMEREIRRSWVEIQAWKNGVTASYRDLPGDE